MTGLGLPVLLVVFVVAADHTTACKPDPQGYLLGLRELARVAPGVPASET